jgi:KipI family sensor histidine kinase inhibitor
MVQLGNGLDVAIGQRCALVATALRAAGISGITDIVPTFDAVAVHYDPRLFGAASSHKNLPIHIESVLAELGGADVDSRARLVEIPVCYGGEHGPDLADVAQQCGLTPEEVIALHSGTPAYVFMLGFAPGAPYIGIHDAALSIGRRETPRTLLPAGSVAIANRQTMIYPNASPGGWHILGATPAVLFDPAREPATLLAPGDSVRFVPISASEYEAMKRGQP